MPPRTPKACRVRGCPHTTTDSSGYCESHKSEGWKQYKPGQSRHQRGYGSKWDCTRAWTYRHWMGTGTVGVMIAGSDLINPIPEESTETAARQHIEPLAPVAGSDLYVFRPVAHTVDFHIRVTPDTPEIRAAITAELRSFLLRDGYPQGELKVSRISEAISGANGEYSHQLLAPVDNISIAKNELAVLGTISWT